MIRCNANLFRIVNACASTEETRHYLNGVFIHANPNGLGCLLVATDGHRMLVAHDATGEASSPAIVALNSETLKLCGGKNTQDRIIQIDPTVAGAAADILEAGPYAPPELIGRSPFAIVDGTFPDWSRVLPKASGPLIAPDIFDAWLLAEFGRIGAELAGGRYRREGASMRLTQRESGRAALIRWHGVDHAFGVLMPKGFGTDDAGKRHLLAGLPSFMGRPAEVEATAAAAKIDRTRAAA